VSARVGLARTEPSYAGLVAPFGPGAAYPELARLGGTPPDENHVYAAVRAALAAAGLDEERFGSAGWNPLGDLVEPGARIVLKPNLIRHWNPCDVGTLDSVVTHGAVLRAMADYAWLAAGDAGSVAIAEAPQHDCDWDTVAAHTGLDALVRLYAQRGRELEVIDLRREAVRYAGGVVVERWTLPGDPAGYRRVDLGAHSAFHDSGLDPSRFRGAEYDPQPTTEHHTGGRHEYLLSETVLSSDLVVNLPKLKTHKKTGVTLALKNLVGINGDKNLLPHHCVGSAANGGDEFPGQRPLDRARSAATELARGLLRREIGTRLVGWVRRAEDSARGSDFVRSGNWYGNRTTWRMCLDLNRVLYYSDRKGEHFDAAAPVRRVLTVIDGVVAGEGQGPLAPADRPLGVVLASLDPIALDLAAIRLMGFDEAKIPKVWETMRTPGLRLGAVREIADVDVRELTPDGAGARALGLDELGAPPCFVAHSGWVGHLERIATAAGQGAAPCAG
jgi:uncharacterized protein (DUF362 family)